MISHRFDYFVDEHFKTRKWTLGKIKILNGAKEMKIVNYSNWESLPIPQNPLPNKVIGFGSIVIYYFDQNVLTFLRRFYRFFASCSTTLFIRTENVRISEFIVLNIWPMFKDTTIVLDFDGRNFPSNAPIGPVNAQRMSIPSYYWFQLSILPGFSSDDSANASDDQVFPGVFGAAIMDGYELDWTHFEPLIRNSNIF